MAHLAKRNDVAREPVIRLGGCQPFAGPRVRGSRFAGSTICSCGFRLLHVASAFRRKVGAVTILIHMIRISALFTLLLIPALLTTPAAQPAPSTVVRAARWLDVSAGQIRTPAVIVIQAGKIASVGGDVPAGAQAIDLGDVTVLPGLLDAHTHLTYDIDADWVTRPVRELPADAALRGARNARRTLEAGFTTVRDVGAPGFADVSLMKAIDAGMIPGPRIVPAGYALGITGGHCDETGWAPRHPGTRA